MSEQRSCDISSRSGIFKPNKERGFWSNSNHFFYACMCNAFRMDLAYKFSTFDLGRKGGIIYILISMLLNVVLFAFPIVFMQTFLGQFSSTGYISAFRIAPLFKGVGYIALANNLCCLTFYAIFAAVPILLFIDSLHLTLPWSCDSRQIPNYTYDNVHCSGNQSNFDTMEVPSVEYFWEKFHTTYLFSLYGCVIVVWLLVAVAICNTTEKIGQTLRYSSMTLMTLLSIVFLRMMFLPGALEGLKNFGNDFDIKMYILLPPMLTMSTFGPGWGSILSMASYNKFKTDINKFSWLICFSQFGVLILMGFLFMFTESHLEYKTPSIRISNRHMLWTSLLSIPSSLATMEFPHLWTWMFLAVLIIGNINLMIVQTFSIITALFDEYETLRCHKIKVTLGLSGIMALASAYFCTKDGIYFSDIMAQSSISTQTVLNLLLLIIIVWVYGRERFQRDVEFMTSQVLQTWKIYTVRFVTPFFLGITLFIGFALLLSNYRFLKRAEIGLFFNIITWLVLPLYCLLKLLQTNGSFSVRFKRSVKPTDWYPTDPEQRQRYEETIENPERFQPLATIAH